MPRPHALLRAGFPYVTTVWANRNMFYPSDIAVGKDGIMYVVTHRKGGKDALIAGPISVVNLDDEEPLRFDLPEGGLVDEPPVGDGQFLWPVGIVMDSDEKLYVSDEAADRVTVLSKTGDFLGKWGEHGSGDGELDRPSGLALDPDENVYVTDTRNHRIQRFTQDGEFLGGFGKRGAGAGEFDMPWGVTVDDEGNVYVSDWGNDRVQKLTPEGELIFEFGGAGDGDGELNGPAGIEVDQDGDIYVCDWGNNRVQLFDADGRFVQKFLGDATLTKTEVQELLSGQSAMNEYNRLREMSVNIEAEKLFYGPRAVTVDDQGRMYVADFEMYRIQVYQKEAYRLDEEQIAPPLPVPKLKYI